MGVVSKSGLVEQGFARQVERANAGQRMGMHHMFNAGEPISVMVGELL